MAVSIFRVVAVFITTIFVCEVSAFVGRVVLNRLLVAVVVAIRVLGSRFVVARVFCFIVLRLVVSGVSGFQVLRPAISMSSVVVGGNLSPLAVVGSLILVIVRSDVVGGGDMVGLSLVVVVLVMVRV